MNGWPWASADRRLLFIPGEGLTIVCANPTSTLSIGYFLMISRMFSVRRSIQGLFEVWAQHIASGAEAEGIPAR